MSEAVTLVLSVAAGTLLGAVFFGGLWWTIRKSLSAERPALWLLGSLLLRISIVLAGFHVVSGAQWDRLLACLTGFVIARIVVTRLAGRRAGSGNALGKEIGHAP